MTQASLFSKAAPTLALARRKGHQGAARAGQRAGDPWVAAACLVVLRYAGQFQSQAPWLLESVRDWAERSSLLPAPPDARAWGVVIQQLKRAGLIRAVGYAPARSSHGSAKVLWQVTR